MQTKKIRMNENFYQMCFPFEQSFNCVVLCSVLVIHFNFLKVSERLRSQRRRFFFKMRCFCQGI